MQGSSLGKLKYVGPLKSTRIPLVGCPGDKVVYPSD